MRSVGRTLCGKVGGVVNGKWDSSKHPRYPKGTSKGGQFKNQLVAKIEQLAQDLKAGKYNPKRYNGEVVKMNNLENDEREFVYGKINSDLSDEEKELLSTTRRLYNDKLKRDYLYYIEYDENGKHYVIRFYIDDDIY